VARTADLRPRRLGRAEIVRQRPSEAAAAMVQHRGGEHLTVSRELALTVLTTGCRFRSLTPLAGSWPRSLPASVILMLRLSINAALGD
jgi:hypothetical protein